MESNYAVGDLILYRGSTHNYIGLVVSNISRSSDGDFPTFQVEWWKNGKYFTRMVQEPLNESKPPKIGHVFDHNSDEFRIEVYY